MMTLFRLTLIALLFTLPLSAFDRVIIWGHKLHSHSHSYIHYGFYRAFKSLGYKTYWVSTPEELSCLDLSNSLFLTEGQCIHNIPWRMDCDYLLHNVNEQTYDAKIHPHRHLKFQVYTNDCKERQKQEHSVELAPFTYFSHQHQIVYMPWATDLLPPEIDMNIRLVQRRGERKKTRKVVWIGTMTRGTFSNFDEIDQFVQAANADHMTFYINKQPVSPKQNVAIVRDAYFAPAIVGRWQKEKGYIPCRIFKNISYGALGITNSKEVYTLFNQKIVYDPDTAVLYEKAKEASLRHTPQAQIALMNLVKNEHTYINRVELLLRCLKQVKEHHALSVSLKSAKL